MGTRIDRICVTKELRVCRDTFMWQTIQRYSIRNQNY